MLNGREIFKNGDFTKESSLSKLFGRIEAGRRTANPAFSLSCQRLELRAAFGW
jgi:hypothetical protein